MNTQYWLLVGISTMSIRWYSLAFNPGQWPNSLRSAFLEFCFDCDYYHVGDVLTVCWHSLAVCWEWGPL